MSLANSLRWLCAAFVLAALVVSAQDLDLDGGGDGAIDGLLQPGGEIELDEPGSASLEGLASSCYLPIALWTHVRPEPKRGEKAPAGDWRWVLTAEGAQPKSDQPVTTRIRVPAAGSYRVFLRQLLPPRDARPVELTIYPLAGDKPDATAVLTHRFGTRGLGDPMARGTGKGKLPVVFESEPDRIAVTTRALPVWEYVDVALKQGGYELRLRGTNPACRVSAVLLTQAKAFHPSLNSFPEYNTLSRIYLRFRVRDGKGADRHEIAANLVYHWAGRRVPGNPEPAWGWKVGKTAAVQTGEWTEFVDATEAMVPGPGPWSTCNVQVKGIESGVLQVEVAWYPRPAAVMERLETALAEEAARFRVPHGEALGVDGREQPAWGVWRADHLTGFVPEGEILKRYFQWADEAVTALGLPADHPLPKHLLFNTSVRTTPPYRDEAARALARLGITWLEGAPRSTVRELGLVDADILYNTSDYTAAARTYGAGADRLARIKVGDEIHTRLGASRINSSKFQLADFHAYIREQAAAAGMSVYDFIGTEDLAEIRCLEGLPRQAGIYERRLYYLSERFMHLASVPYFKQITDGFLARFPKAEVYNNYSPHPVFLTGTTMNVVDWFVLCRHQAQTLGWGEDWATGGSWGLGTRYQCTSFYAALVACATRRHGYPGGFYVGANCGGSANKIFSCLAQGLTRLNLYSWGPLDAWAEGSNSWSERRSEYDGIARALYALGPADEIISAGERLPARTAVLYNRSHEIWQGGTGRMNRDWMWTYIASYSASEPMDVVIEDDIAGHLATYRLLFAGGYNLSRRDADALGKWVADGRLLVLSGGGGMYDLANDPNPNTVALAGVRQRPLPGNAADAGPVTFTVAGPVPAGSFAADGLRFGLEPTTAQVVARWPDGEPAAALQAVGKGHVLTLGFQLGMSYQAGGQALSACRTWQRDLTRAVAGAPAAELDLPASEATVWTHRSGLAVLLNSYAGNVDEPIRLTVRPARPVTEVRSALHGPLPFERDGEVITTTIPSLQPVDCVILR